MSNAFRRVDLLSKLLRTAVCCPRTLQTAVFKVWKAPRSDCLLSKRSKQQVLPFERGRRKTATNSQITSNPMPRLPLLARLHARRPLASLFLSPGRMQEPQASKSLVALTLSRSSLSCSGRDRTPGNEQLGEHEQLTAQNEPISPHTREMRDLGQNLG
ncbi:hypothetical protein MA16_Dca005306 [Dendrobium catenatum]|uniref:Uncharacterized protein n=1 Tax=Dendrobium catenatum TaxID=906689 RepID=A0A2I0VLX2_9ASPA|nr:hypothetical protein MA16_Dca005306 [Dendrobium catenatum]